MFTGGGMANQEGSNIGKPVGPQQSDKVFRRLVLVGAGLAFIVLIVIGAYLGYEKLWSSTSTATVAAEGEAVSSPVQAGVGTAEPLSGTMPAQQQVQATATAACETFQQQFPGTPCPPIDQFFLGATATAACSDFHSLFPGTPCP
jgi:hypothetical protein